MTVCHDDGRHVPWPGTTASKVHGSKPLRDWRWRAAKGISVRHGHLSPTLSRPAVGRNEMSIGTILLIVLVLLLIGAIPSWSHSRSWGYGPSGGIGLLVVILLILLLMGKI